nr:hypothetical protein [uncultured Cupriavidus sp.]
MPDDKKPDGVDKFLTWAKFSPTDISNIKDIAGTLASLASGIGAAFSAVQTVQNLIASLGFLPQKKDPMAQKLDDILKTINTIYAYLKDEQKSEQRRNVDAWRTQLGEIKTAMQDAATSRSEPYLTDLRSKRNALYTSLNQMLSPGYSNLPFQRRFYKYAPPTLTHSYPYNIAEYRTNHWIDVATPQYMEFVGTSDDPDDPSQVTYATTEDLAGNIFDPGYYIDVLIGGLRLYFACVAVEEPLFRSTCHLRGDLLSVRNKLGEFIARWENSMMRTIFTHTLLKIPMVPSELGNVPDPGMTMGLMDPGYGVPNGVVDPVSGVWAMNMEFSDGFLFVQRRAPILGYEPTNYLSFYQLALASALSNRDAAYQTVYAQSGIEAFKDAYRQLGKLVSPGATEVGPIAPPEFFSGDLVQVGDAEELSLGTLGYFAGKPNVKYPATRLRQYMEKVIRIPMARRMDQSGIQLGYMLRITGINDVADVELVPFDPQKNPNKPLPAFPTNILDFPIEGGARVYDCVEQADKYLSPLDEEQFDQTGSIPDKARLFMNPRAGQIKLNMHVTFEYDENDADMPLVGHAVVTIKNLDAETFRDSAIVTLNVIERYVRQPGVTGTRPAGSVDVHIMPTVLRTTEDYFKDYQAGQIGMARSIGDIAKRYVFVETDLKPQPGPPVERWAIRDDVLIKAATRLQQEHPREFARITKRVSPVQVEDVPQQPR